MQYTDEQVAAARESYLHEVSLRIQHRLSPLEAYESVQEMRLHLDSMARAYEEMGMEPFHAMQAALSKFGEASQVGQGLLGATPLNRWRVALVFLLHIAGAFFLGFALVLMIEVYYASSHPGPGVRISFVADALTSGIVSLLIGTMGWHSRREATPFALTCVGLVNGIIALILLLEGHSLVSMLNENFLVMSTAVYLLGFESVRSARFLRRNAMNLKAESTGFSART